jgi:hypothetical protein
MRLTSWALAERADWRELNGCSCHISPPCNSCIHPGNPLNQEQDPECWEEGDDEEIHPIADDS